MAGVWKSVIDLSPRATCNADIARMLMDPSVIDLSPRATCNLITSVLPHLCSVIDLSPRATCNNIGDRMNEKIV